MGNENQVINDVIIEDVNGNEIITQEEKEVLALQQFKENYMGERVNMSDMESIFHYGEETLLELDNVITASSNDLGNHKIGEAQLIIKQKIDEIMNFNPNLDKQEEIQRKIEERSKTFGGKLINKITGAANLVGRDTYTEACKQVEDNCEAISKIVNETGARVTEEFKSGIQYQSEQERVIQQLSDLVKMGRIDLEEYSQRVSLKKEMGPQIGEDERIFSMQVKKAETNIRDFKEKLATLDSALVLAINDLDKNMELQEVNKKSMKQLYNIQTSTMPILKVVGKDAVRIRNAKDTLDVIEAVNDGLNNAIQQNSKKSLDNIRKSQEITTKGTIYIETMNAVVKDLAEGKKILDQSHVQEQKALDARNKTNEKLLSEMKKITEALKQNINYNENDVELLEAMTLPELPSANSNTNTTAKSPLIKTITPPKSGN